MNKHTPTPWAINQYGKVVHVNSNGRDTISTDGFAICGDAESAANTAHIVRCVNSHEALVKALTALVQLDSYETEYDGRMYTICSSCGAQLSEGKQHSDNCDFTAARAALAAAGAPQ